MGRVNIRKIQDKYAEEYLIWMKSPDKLTLEGAETLESLKIGLCRL